MQYRTRDGDVLDAVCHEFYGTARGHTEHVLEANPGLADIGPVLAAGIIIELPAPFRPDIVRATIRLWD